MAMLARDALGHGHALFLGLVRQHGAAHHVAHGPDAGQVGLAVTVDHDGAALIELQAHGFGVQANRVGHAADRHDELVNLKRLGFALGVGVSNADALLGRLDVANLHAQLDLQALLVERLLGFLGNLLVHGTQEGRQAFEDGDVGAQTAPHAAHFQADHARADHTQLLGHGAHAQRAVVGQHVDFVKCHAWQRAGVGAGGHDDLLAHQGFAGCTLHLDFVAAFDGLGERATAMEEADLVLLEQVQDAVVVLLHHGVLAADHGGHVHGHLAGADAVLGKVLGGMLEVLGRLQQRLGGNAAHVGAGAARSGAALVVLPLVDTGDLHAQLGRADGGDVAARACADHDDVELLAHGYFSVR